MDPADVFNFRQVPEGPVEPQLIPGFGGTSHIVRVVDDNEDEWVDVVVGADGAERVWDHAPCFADTKEAIAWLTSSTS